MERSLPENHNNHSHCLNYFYTGTHIGQASRRDCRNRPTRRHSRSYLSCRMDWLPQENSPPHTSPQSPFRWYSPFDCQIRSPMGRPAHPFRAPLSPTPLHWAVTLAKTALLAQKQDDKTDKINCSCSGGYTTFYLLNQSGDIRL